MSEPAFRCARIAAPCRIDGGNLYQQTRNVRTAQDHANLQLPHGSILRLDPLPRGAPGEYAVPDSNPLVGQADALAEIWAYGLRNPSKFSWDEAGDGKMLIADIGEGNIEVINIGVAGANYGWGVREGTFVVDRWDRPSCSSCRPMMRAWALLTLLCSSTTMSATR